MTISFSPSLAKLAPALAAAQGELEDATKSSVNPAFRSKYADLAEVLQTLRPILSKHGLGLVQTVGFYDATAKTIQVTTALIHASGELITDSVNMPVTKADAQGVGSAVTYARRYGAAAICGISQADDDGNAASGREPAPGKVGGKGPKSAPAPDADQAKALVEALEALKPGDRAGFEALGRAFAALAPSDQTKVLPAVQAAKTRTSAS